MKRNFTHHLLLLVIPLLIIMTPPPAWAGHDQQILDRKITLELKDVPLSLALARIEVVGGVKFVYSPSQIDLDQTVSIIANNKKLGVILNDLFGPMGISYTADRVKEFILLKPLKAEAPHPSPDKKTNAESGIIMQSVTGTVTDAGTQKPIAGVNILVKGTTFGTTTDANGKYIISAEEKDILVFSFIGYKKFETQVGGRTAIDVLLEEDLAALKEVVINAGYYLTTEKLKTGNISKITAAEIENQPVTSPIMALQGRIPGVDITPYNGTPGGAVKIQVRGQNTLRFDGGYPLYVIDGIPIDSKPVESASSTLALNGFDPLSFINPNNIESIEVLKDADATALYGSRGANGVILITTKGGATTSRPALDLNLYKGIGKMANRVDMLNTEEYLMMRREAFRNDGATPALSDFDVNGTWDTTSYTNWQEVLLGGSSDISDLQGNISLGAGNGTFRLGGGYHKETMVFSDDFGFSQSNVHLVYNYGAPDERLRVNVSFVYGSTKQKQFQENNFINNALSLAPNAPDVYDEKGNLNWATTTFAGANISSWQNPLSRLLHTHDAQSTNLIANGLLAYQVGSGLSAKANLGYTEMHENELIRHPISAGTPEDQMGIFSSGESIFGANNRTSWIIEPHLTYDRALGAHQLNIVVGTTWQENISSYQSIRATGYPSDVLLNTQQGATTIHFDVDDNSEYRYEALFARVGYNFNDKYILNLTGRRDGSSRFGPDNRFGDFGALGGAWIFSNENFFKNNSSILSFGKLRASYGITGNDQIGDNKFYNTYSLSTDQYQDRATLNPTALFNPRFAWEETKKSEVGIELGLFDRRVSAEVSWYRNLSGNQLINYRLPATTGFTSVLANLDAVIENKGWEMLLKTTNVDNRNLKWTTILNLTFPRNTLLEFEDIEGSTYAKYYKVGEPVSIQRLYSWKGVNPQTGEYELVDKDANGVINDADKTFMKPTSRKYFGGINNLLVYRNLKLAFLFQVSAQDAFRPATMPGTTRYNQPRSVLSRWQQEGDVTNVAKFSQSSKSRSTFTLVQQSDYFIADASFVRLKTVSLSYTLAEGLAEKLKLRYAELFFQAQNLYTYTKYDGFDPETGNSLPPLLMITMGIQAKL